MTLDDILVVGGVTLGVGDGNHLDRDALVHLEVLEPVLSEEPAWGKFRALEALATGEGVANHMDFVLRSGSLDLVHVLRNGAGAGEERLSLPH